MSNTTNISIKFPKKCLNDSQEIDKHTPKWIPKCPKMGPSRRRHAVKNLLYIDYQSFTRSICTTFHEKRLNYSQEMEDDVQK